MLSLPVRRWELLAGTFLGVLVLAVSAAAYGAGGLSVVIGVKTGWWTAGPLMAACLAAFAFASVYGAMLAASVFVRSAALSTVVGASVAAAGILASHRAQVAEAFSPGFARSAFEATSLFFPRIASVADMGATLAAHGQTDLVVLARLLAGLLAFAAATFALGAWRFEVKDW
jgi:Cu-processing system permease protein